MGLSQRLEITQLPQKGIPGKQAGCLPNPTPTSKEVRSALRGLQLQVRKPPWGPRKTLEPCGSPVSPRGSELPPQREGAPNRGACCREVLAKFLKCLKRAAQTGHSRPITRSLKRAPDSYNVRKCSRCLDFSRKQNVKLYKY